ncbi:hypothetical protein SK128_006726 [Halocaridina rubra]|uniref:Uncharacterized protein n=1 Tax=Halocaridina rubra TaxID=373956 RepID=A0AAN9AEA1_HALRR
MSYLKEVCSKSTKDLQEACSNTAFGATDGQECIMIANTRIFEVLTNEDVNQQLAQLEQQKSSSAMFKSLMNYIHQVETILFFVKSSRNADLSIHLEASEALKMSCLSAEFRGQFGLQVSKPEGHHDVWPTIIKARAGSC